MAVALTLSVAACTSKASTPPAQVAAEQFLTALGDRDPAKAAALTTSETEAATSLQATLTGLGEKVTGSYDVTGLREVKDSSATAAYKVSWTIPGAAKKWSYAGTVPVVKKGDSWKVDWSPAAVFPGLLAGQHLALTRTQPPRADLLDSAGQPLFTETDVVTVGVQPSKVTDLGALAQKLAEVLGVTAADIVADVTPAKPDAFVPVITIRKDLYDSVKLQIYDLPGAVFQAGKRLLSPATGWGQPLLGGVGAATKEIIDASSGTILEGDQTGLSGLQKSYDATLRGLSGYDAYAAADKDGQTNQKLATVIGPVPGKPVQLTLDRAAQSVAQTTLAGVPEQAAIVALQPSTGKILAVANSASAQGNIAMNGRYPAGSTFKVVTYGAAFSADPATTPDTQAACPGTMTVDGKVFQNENAFDKGTVSLRDAFAYSCNTTAIDLALKLGDSALPTYAAKLGLGATWDLPVDAFSGAVPVAAGQTELAGDAIGQGKVEVSPLAMASIAGATASGAPIAPSLEGGKQATAGAALDPTVTASMATVMRAVVEQPFGTANDLVDLPGAIVGKTGTAEFGTDVPPKSHSWFVGVRGDLTIAVFVYGGESSSDSAVPLAKTFFTDYP